MQRKAAVLDICGLDDDAEEYPSHYTRDQIEIIDFIEAQGLPFYLENVVLYLCCAGYKGDEMQDVKKARWFLNKYITLKEHAAEAVQKEDG